MRMQFNVLACALMLHALTTNAEAQEPSLKNADINGDGKVTVAEFTHYAESKLTGFEQLAAFVQKVDANGNGEISKDEFDNRLDVLQELQSAPADDSIKRAKQSDADKQGETETAKTDSATAAYNELKKLVRASNWEKASGHMTKKAQDEFCVEQIMSAKGIIESDMPMHLPGLDDLLDDLEDAFDKHNLNDIDIEVKEMFKMEFRMDSGDDDESSEDEKSDDAAEKEKNENAKRKTEDAHKKQVSNQAKILRALDKDGKRWEIVNDLWEAKQKSPFSMSDLTGDVETEEIDGNQTVLKIKMVPPPRDQQPGIAIHVVAPPAYIQMEKVDGRWKYAGRDQKRTEKAIKEFMENQRQSFGDGGNRTDF